MQADTLDRESGKRAVRIEPLGRDRHGREYFVFPGDTRVFVRNLSGSGPAWGVYTTDEEVAALHDALTDKGVGERALRKALEQLDPMPNPAAEEAAPVAAAVSTRRSARVASSARADHHDGYVNSLAPKARD